VFDHEPVDTLRTLPTLAVPVIAGSAVFRGDAVAAPATAVRERVQTSAAKSAVLGRKRFAKTAARAAAFPNSA
jgi:hypothetical protein